MVTFGHLIRPILPSQPLVWLGNEGLLCEWCEGCVGKVLLCVHCEVMVSGVSGLVYWYESECKDVFMYVCVRAACVRCMTSECEGG